MYESSRRRGWSVTAMARIWHWPGRQPAVQRGPAGCAYADRPCWTGTGRGRPWRRSDDAFVGDDVISRVDEAQRRRITAGIDAEKDVHQAWDLT